MQGTDPDGFASGLYAQTTDQGKAGDLIVRSPIVQVRDRATITVASGSASDLNLATNTLKNITGILIGTRPATGAAGTLSVQSNQLTLDSEGQLLASTDFGQGGYIDLGVRDVLLMHQSSLISATAGTAQSGGDGGNITINAPFVMALPGENNDIIANAFTGRGGNVTINANSILNFTLNDKGKTFNQLRQQATNDISASSEFGSNGTLNLVGLNVNPAQGAIQLPSTTNIPQPSQGCQTTNTTGQTSQGEFFVTGRGGLPPNPSAPLTSTSILDDLRLPPGLNASQVQVHSSRTPVPNPLAEATHWDVNAQGQIILAAKSTTSTQVKHCKLLD
ncbi:MAG: S-layer family protein [Synechococcales cyanobacterium CRU_2_2]|nr:S-layer family protein [Synechococcales cyanobacterium CRU_2_2]